MPEARRHDPRDVGGSVADLLDGVGDPQDARHALGVLGAARSQHRHDAQLPELGAHAVLETAHLARELLLVEEHRRVGEVHHELGLVLELDEEFLDVLRLVLSHERSRREAG